MNLNTITGAWTGDWTPAENVWPGDVLADGSMVAQVELVGPMVRITEVFGESITVDPTERIHLAPRVSA